MKLDMNGRSARVAGLLYYVDEATLLEFAELARIHSDSEISAAKMDVTRSVVLFGCTKPKSPCEEPAICVPKDLPPDQGSTGGGYIPYQPPAETPATGSSPSAPAPVLPAPQGTCPPIDEDGLPQHDGALAMDDWEEKKRRHRAACIRAGIVSVDEQAMMWAIIVNEHAGRYRLSHDADCGHTMVALENRDGISQSLMATPFYAEAAEQGLVSGDQFASPLQNDYTSSAPVHKLFRLMLAHREKGALRHFSFGPTNIYLPLTALAKHVPPTKGGPNTWEQLEESYWRDLRSELITAGRARFPPKVSAADDFSAVEWLKRHAGNQAAAEKLWYGKGQYEGKGAKPVAQAYLIWAGTQ